MKTAISETVSEITVKPISPRHGAGLERVFPPSMCRTIFSIMTMASSTTKPVDGHAISERLSAKTAEPHDPKVAISESGSATPAMMVARTVRRKMSTMVMTSATLR
jgi:hypothetical protein